MSTIPFIEGRLELEARLARHLHRLRRRRTRPDLPASPDEVDAPGEISDADLMGIIRFSDDDEARIKRRVKRILECRKAASGLEHLKRDDRERLEVLKGGARLISIRNEHHADELAAALHGDMPWMAPATEVVWHAMRRSWREGIRVSRSRHSSSPARPALAKANWRDASASCCPRCEPAWTTDPVTG
ncbi:hypothetical protein PE067_10890 [Paracoccus sp. DMF-8]|uniref:hypothetical protein n=1 Tax=Paracoccus sp. DMF-8 TaxID=3019445 RepID=UPI0023E82A04|nr:hypothetical protein [Paracoccus sp. DMF-8]MDF3606606.1 hypothetical protein [Paracoccus sp. DMF-8]